jgi:hypothetical protein
MRSSGAPPVSLLSVANGKKSSIRKVDTGGKFATGMMAVSMTPAVPVAKFAADVVDTGGTFATGVVDTGVKFSACFVDHQKICNGHIQILFGLGEDNS